MSPEGIPHGSTNSEIGDYLQDLLKINADNIISEALKLLKSKTTKLQELKAKIVVETEQIDRGKVVDGEVVFAKLQ